MVAALQDSPSKRDSSSLDCRQYKLSAFGASLSSRRRERQATSLSEGPCFWAVRGPGSGARVAAAWVSTTFAVLTQLSWRVCRETASQTASDSSCAWSWGTGTASSGTCVVPRAFILCRLFGQLAQSPSGEAGGRATGLSRRHRPPPSKAECLRPFVSHLVRSGGCPWSCCLSFDHTPCQ